MEVAGYIVKNNTFCIRELKFDPLYNRPFYLIRMALTVLSNTSDIISLYDLFNETLSY